MYPKSLILTSSLAALILLNSPAAAQDVVYLANSFSGAPSCDGRSSCPTATGAGTELKKIYARFGIVPGPNCSCNETARIMDMYPAQWSRDNMAWIESRIEAAAPGLGVQYRPILVRRTIKMAIRRAARQER